MSSRGRRPCSDHRIHDDRAARPNSERHGRSGASRPHRAGPKTVVALVLVVACLWLLIRLWPVLLVLVAALARRRHPEPGRPLARGEARRARARDRDRLHRLLRPRRPGGRPHGPDAGDAGGRASRARTGVARATRGPSRRLSPHRPARGLASRPPARRPDERRRREGVRLLAARLRGRRVRAERPLPRRSTS